jgi:hypothetical protein
MPVCEHVVSYRNGLQVMVKGLSLRDMGYCCGARVQVTDPTGNPANVPWVFVVSNDEHATLGCKNTPPPPWIQPAVRIQIEVWPPAAGGMPAGGLGEGVPARLGDPAPARPDAPTQATAMPQPRPELPARAIYAVDVGSPNGGLAWARLAPHVEQIPCGSTDYNLFLELLACDLRENLPVALGFEAPLFLPVAFTIGNLTRARDNEPAAFSAGAGACVTTIAIPLMALTLRHIRSKVDPPPRVSLDAERWLAPGSLCPNLLLWEAFVWGPSSHADVPNAAGLCEHVQDAATAVRAFVQWEAAAPRPPSNVTAQDPISTAGAALLWSELDNDIRLLHQQTLVLRPMQRMGGDVVPYVA